MGSKFKMNGIANLLQTCIDNKSLLLGKVFHANVLRNNLLTNTFLCNRLIELYSKCNDSSSADRTFHYTPHKDIYSWNAIFSFYYKDGNLNFARKEKALDVYKLMVSEGFLPTHITFGIVLSACGSVLDLQLGKRCHGLVKCNVLLGEQVHGLAIKLGFENDLYFPNSLLDTYAKNGIMNNADIVFHNLGKVSIVSWNIMIAGYGQKGNSGKSYRVF
ncbi:hypothetical protein F3Y22_tig00110393pilonHSYRG00214 [Hibiscus syriacus]|uniref:Pentatricopeptide repeat-containing protein n=1 Tax=Hibiscus syriacus TaxID=106335 RepID=A0A6A3APA4_HIBSY|nr:hypothetical protein F3Y22_tig00110393pilonHSYRG00214 [Hibiscus syriacus]